MSTLNAIDSKAGPSVQAFLDTHENPVRALRSVPLGTPWIESRLVAEYLDWQQEQAAWRTQSVLMHQSEHMADVLVKGPDALKLFRSLSINAYRGFEPGQARQFIATSPDGYLIGDGILVYLPDGSFDLVADAMVAWWVQFHIEAGGYDVEYVVDQPNHWFRPLRGRDQDPVFYRFEVQGPAALEVIAAATGTTVPDVKLFRLTEFEIAGHRVQAIRHGMAGQPGFELFGPFAEGEAVRTALLEAGKPFDLVPVGYTAYFTANLESGWFVVGLPAIFTGEALRGFREWLPVDALVPITGSMGSEDIEDYYVSPYDVGYGQFVSKDHDFIGQAGLKRLADRPHREKVTLIWDENDLGRLYADTLRPESGEPPLFRGLHDISFTSTPFDEIRVGDTVVGFAVQSAYVAADRRFISLATIDAEHADPGTEVTVVWGDPPGRPHPQHPAHRVVHVRATVAPTPFSEYARESYRSKLSTPS